MRNTIHHRQLFFWIGFLLLALALSFIRFRLDLTSEKRYSLSEQSKELMKTLDSPLKVKIYLDGNLNSGFLRLKKSTVEMLEELKVYSSKPIKIEFEDPSSVAKPEEREKYYAELASRGLIPTNVYERDDDGKIIQKTIFPWLEMEYKGKKVTVNLLKNIRGNSGDENLNISIIELEYEITDAVRRLVSTEVEKIAFLEGHDELSEEATYDISKSLSRYFQIDRGRLGNDAAILSPYKVVIIAKPQNPFSEKEKLIIDQYIMNGGEVLWLIDGVRVAEENFSVSGMSPAIPLDLNLSDQLFRYGIRINPIILQDVQCAQMPVNVAESGETPHFEPVPWFFAPLLLTSNAHPITRNIPPVRSEFCSNIDLVGENKQVSAVLLLATSDNTHIIGTPTNIDLREMPSASDKNYFNTGYVPVGVLLEGSFESVFANRMLPDSVMNISKIRSRSVNTRQIFVADGDIIKNEISIVPGDSAALPLGFDRFTGLQYGNKDFIENAVLYLADEDGWMQLKNKNFKLRLLNKQIVLDQKLKWQLINVLFPLVIFVLFGVVFQLVRKRKYLR